MVILIEAGKTFDKIQHFFMIKKKTFKLGIRENLIYSYKKPLSNILLKDESGCSP